MHQQNSVSVVELTLEEMTVISGGDNTDPISELIRLIMGGGRPMVPIQ